jgi:hypothetical protein
MSLGRAARTALCALAIAAAMPFLGAGQGQLPGVEPLHESGQDVTPSFEGWYPNPDGTFNLSFGYMNRNLKEVVDIPIGPNNRIEPGAADQGQPTHFLARRQMGLFTVTVPKDFGKRRVSWTLTRDGRSNTVTGHIDDRWLIDALEDPTIKNKPPVLRFQQSGPPHLGPRPLAQALTATVGLPATLEAWVSDDKVSLRGDQKQAEILTVVWQKYRAPGEVTFAKDRPEVDRATGHVTTTATFKQPGEYWLRLMVNDYTGPTGASGQCCWTNGIVKVSVK